MQADAARHGPGGNEAPVEEVARDQILARLAPFRARVALLVERADGAGITSEEDAGRVSDLTKQISALKEAIGSARVDVKAPYDNAAAIVHSEAHKLLDDLNERTDKLLGMLKAYGDEVKRAREQKAARDAEAERKRQVDAAKAAASSERMVHQDKAEAPAPKASAPRWPERKSADPIVRGDMGSKTVLRARSSYEIVDVRKLPDQILNAPKVREAIISVVRVADGAGILTDLDAIGIKKTTEDKAQVL